MATKFPFGAADVPTQEATTGALSYEINNLKTFIKLSGLTGIVTAINLTIADNIQAGAELIIEVVQGATGRNVAINGSTGFDSNVPDLTGVANDVDVIRLEYDGSAFVATQLWNKTVDAV